MAEKIKRIKNKLKMAAVASLVFFSGKSMAQSQNTSSNDRLNNLVEAAAPISQADLMNSTKHSRRDKPLTEDYTSYLGRVNLHNTQCSTTPQGWEMISGTLENGNTLISLQDYKGAVKRTILDNQGQKIQEEHTSKKQQSVTFFQKGKPNRGHIYDKDSHTYFDVFYTDQGQLKLYDSRLDPKNQKFDKHKEGQIAKNPNLRNAKEY